MTRCVYTSFYLALSTFQEEEEDDNSGFLYFNKVTNHIHTYILTYSYQPCCGSLLPRNCPCPCPCHSQREKEREEATDRVKRERETPFSLHPRFQLVKRREKEKEFPKIQREREGEKRVRVCQGDPPQRNATQTGSFSLPHKTDESRDDKQRQNKTKGNKRPPVNLFFYCLCEKTD